MVLKTIKNYSHNSQNLTFEKDVKVNVQTVENEDHHYEEDIKVQILNKALEYVDKHGWSIESLIAGAEAVGYPGVTHGLFPNGGGDLVHHFNIKCNEILVEQMKTWPKEDLKHSRVPVKFLENALMTRLLMIQPYKKTWAKAMAIQTLPNNVPKCLASVQSLADDICYHSGDRSVDFNWYVRRMGLASIYKASELYYLTDSSEDNIATRKFVQSRLQDAQVVQTVIDMNPVTSAPQVLTAAFVTAKNILGMNTVNGGATPLVDVGDIRVAAAGQTVNKRPCYTAKALKLSCIEPLQWLNSDHRPVLMRLGSLIADCPPITKTITNWQKVSAALEEIDTPTLNNIPNDIVSTDDIDNAIGALTNHIRTVVEDSSRTVPANSDR
ncbi:Ubiquinone biosynthesis protein COQ9, mitochondrial [Eumeta japonica]|uniref:Ubiquinone biosynthesis protein n=1 Tax=Eumeta variegata TaxID=151549 RepID=A0A4C1U0X5_EUMVA|nr:Ubiquinone biosynthesis protein COQ9, mitochondrial [Eumeta japonica]